jgi:hypothetical protein
LGGKQPDTGLEDNSNDEDQPDELDLLYTPNSAARLRYVLKPPEGLSESERFRRLLRENLRPDIHARVASPDLISPAAATDDSNSQSQTTIPNSTVLAQHRTSASQIRSNFESELGSPPPHPRSHYIRQSSSVPASPFTSEDADADGEIVKIVSGNALRKSSVNQSALDVSRRLRFRIKDQPREQHRCWSVLFAAIKLDLIRKGPELMESERTGAKVIDDRPWFNLISLRYQQIFGQSIDHITTQALEAVFPSSIF